MKLKRELIVPSNRSKIRRAQADLDRQKQIDEIRRDALIAAWLALLALAANVIGWFV